jgi:hypothetical protein
VVERQPGMAGEGRVDGHPVRGLRVRPGQGAGRSGPSAR